MENIDLYVKYMNQFSIVDSKSIRILVGDVGRQQTYKKTWKSRKSYSKMWISTTTHITSNQVYIHAIVLSKIGYVYLCQFGVFFYKIIIGIKSEHISGSFGLFVYYKGKQVLYVSVNRNSQKGMQILLLFKK